MTLILDILITLLALVGIVMSALEGYWVASFVFSVTFIVMCRLLYRDYHSR